MKNNQGRKPTRFIRKNGKVIPIFEKDPSKAQLRKNYNKYGDGANQASRIDAKYEDRAKKKSTVAAVTAVGLATGAFASFAKRPKLAAALGAGALVSAAVGHRQESKQRAKDEVRKENEYVKYFGMDSEGNKPMKFKKKKRK